MTAFLADSNIWVALTITGHEHHSAAKDWLETLSSSDRILFCRSTQQSLLRLLTVASLMAETDDRPLSNAGAWAVFDAFLADSRIEFREDEPEDLDRWWRRYSARNTASPKLWMDAYLAAFARAEGCTLVTTDGAFKQFDGLDFLVLG